MKYNNAYEYKEIDRKTGFGGLRHYDVDGELLPSVTTILGKTKSEETKAGLDAWRKGVGDEEADRVVLQSTTIGSLLHENLEFLLKDGRKPEGPPLVKMMTQTMVTKGFPKLDEWWGLEAALFVKGLYAGTTDLVGVYNKQPVILDFKNARNAKPIEQMDDYFCQLVAYGMAHNDMFGTKIKTGIILMVTQECQFREYVLEGSAYDKAKEDWLRRLTEYYDKYNT